MMVEIFQSLKNIPIDPVSSADHELRNTQKPPTLKSHFGISQLGKKKSPWYVIIKLLKISDKILQCSKRRKNE